jgi:hypothetical protein
MIRRRKHVESVITGGGSPSVKISGPQLIRALKAELGGSRTTPITLDYKPLESGESIERFLGDLIAWVLAGKLHHRSASTCRGIVEAWLKASDLKELEKRIAEIEEGYKIFMMQHPELRRISKEATS